MKTLSDHPLLIGRLLAAHHAREAARQARARRVQRFCDATADIGLILINLLALYLCIVLAYHCGRRLGFWHPAPEAEPQPSLLAK